MKAKSILAVMLMGCLSACSSGNRDSPKRAGEAAGQAGAAAEQADAAIDDGSSRQELYLPDDSVFLPTIEPWPPQPGPAKLKARATTDDDEQKFAGTVSYRIAPTEQNSMEWLDMPRAGEDAEDVFFEAPVTLNQGTSFIQFRVQDAGDPQPTELLDWKIDVK